MKPDPRYHYCSRCGSELSRYTMLDGKLLCGDCHAEMNDREYVKGVLKTESTDFEAVAKRLTDPKMIRLLHGAMGLVTEAGEFLDALKKHVFYGKELDTVNLIEEQGDLFWYMGVLCDTLGVTFGRVKKLNNLKLQKRYGDTFSEGAAINRDLKKEREVLDG